MAMDELMRCALKVDSSIQYLMFASETCVPIEVRPKFDDHRYGCVVMRARLTPRFSRLGYVLHE
jgi:hypothetical protein